MLSHISNYITAIVCLIAFFVIQRIYHKEKLKSSPSNSVDGIKWFALAIFSWGFGATLNIILTHVLSISETSSIVISLGVFFSLANSLFILLSIPSIQHNEKRNIVIQIIERFSNKEVFIIFGGILVMIASVFLISFLTNNTSNYSNNNVIWLIDIPISLVVAFALLQELNKAFKNRGMRFMYLPTFALFLLIVVAVTHRIFPLELISKWIKVDVWNVVGVITSISFKFLFVLLFTILLYSWKLLAESEEKQTELQETKLLRQQIQSEKETLEIANESHLSTIKSLKKEIISLKKKQNQLIKASKVVLSDRQKEVLGNIGVCGNQKSYTEIAEAMNISVDGFQTHVYQIKKVLNISGSDGKEQLITYAKKNQLLEFATIQHD
jgi:DNA-binding CsgD family transcriptional regulator